MPVHYGFRSTNSREHQDICNKDYGTSEIPLLQQDGGPVSDRLYSTGFALLGLHEAVGATGDRKVKQAEDKLAEYLCRIQTRSQKLPYLNGTWSCAFDDRREKLGRARRTLAAAPSASKAAGARLELPPCWHSASGAPPPGISPPGAASVTISKN